jgi:hypothetical protein
MALLASDLEPLNVIEEDFSKIIDIIANEIIYWNVNYKYSLVNLNKKKKLGNWFFKKKN